jgi:hypothetical protein
MIACLSTRTLFLTYTSSSTDIYPLHTHAVCSDQLLLNSLPYYLLSRTGVILENMVHLLESAALGFRHEEKSPYAGEHTKDSEEHVCPESSVFDERGGNEALA